MPPKGQPHAIERTPEYEAFIEKVAQYHTERGTNLDPEPKVGATHVDLYKVFNHVVANGGYDKISEVKLAWRRMIEELNIPGGNIAQTSFQLKTVFLRYLAAYEIKTVHHQEPPPKELLEEQTAKGGSLLTRTWENNPFGFSRPGPDAADRSVAAEEATPVRDRSTANVSSARAARGLREAPPQRVLYQPDTAPSRQTRHSSGHQPSSAAGAPSGPSTSHVTTAGPSNSSQRHPSSTHHTSTGNAMGHGHHPNQSHGHSSHQQYGAHHQQTASASYQPGIPGNVSASVASYEPRSNIIVPVLPVNTPANNPAEFERRKRRRLIQSRYAEDLTPPGQARPSQRFEGPNIYLRCLMSLRSGIPDEQAFALTHLVRISFERGDKYKFESFPGLSDGLIEKAMEVGSIFYEVEWTICYQAEEVEANIECLDGFDGTDDILERITVLEPKKITDDVLSTEASTLLRFCTEAVLTIRNMVQMTENAEYCANCFSLRDLLCIILCLPDLDAVVELKHHALDVAECITPHLELGPDDPLYTVLVNQLVSNDRGMILTTMRALARISMSLEASNKLGAIPPNTLADMTNWMLLNDEELVDACLDFFYQYTAVVTNVEALLTAVNPEDLVGHLVRLLAHGAKKITSQHVITPAFSHPTPSDVVPFPRNLLKRYLTLEEPQRCQHWLRGFFEEDTNSVMTQMVIWEAYQNAFDDALKQAGRPMIRAQDFIANVTKAFTSTSAQQLQENGGSRFVIRGIRARVKPVAHDGSPYYYCSWAKPDGSGVCGDAFSHTQEMYDHMIQMHFPGKDGPNGREPDTTRPVSCRWRDCDQYPKETQDFNAVALHAKVHAAFRPPPSAKGQSYIDPAKTIPLQWEETLTTADERDRRLAAGVPLSAALVLCNIARNVVKTKSEEALLMKHEMGGEGGGWNERLFRPVLPRLFEVLTENKALAPYITNLINLCDLSGDN